MANEDLKRSGPFIMKDGKATDIGLYNHVFDGTDDTYDELLAKEKLLKAVKKELHKRRTAKESKEEITRNFMNGLLT